MSNQTLYEVQTLKGGQWQVDSTYPNRETAIEVARGLHVEKDLDGAKVIKDSYDAASGNARESVIYDSTKKVKDRPAPAAAKDGTTTTTAAAPRPAAAPVARGKKSKDSTVAIKASLWLVVILAGGLGILFGVDYVSAWFNKLF